MSWVSGAILGLVLSAAAPGSPGALSVHGTKQGVELLIGAEHRRLRVALDSNVRPKAAPSAIRVLAYRAGHLLIETETYPSARAGLSRCGAGEETFLRVIGLEPPNPTELLTVKLASCLQNIEPADPGAVWTDSAGKLTVDWLSGPAPGQPQHLVWTIGDKSSAD